MEELQQSTTNTVIGQCDSELASPEVLEAMGISQPAYDEISDIVGHLPTVDELSTLLAMWQQQGRHTGLLSWLKTQPHAKERHNFIVNEAEPQSITLREPRIRECLAIALGLFPPSDNGRPMPADKRQDACSHGDALYLVGDVSELFVNSDYGRQFLHLAPNPIDLGDEQETRNYTEMILNAFLTNKTIGSYRPVGHGGLFGTLLHCAKPCGLGFDILCCREVRLDAFLFGEQGVRYLATLQEPDEDFFLLKLTEAGLNCCFLGRATKGRILVDGMDFGDISAYGILPEGNTP